MEVRAVRPVLAGWVVQQVKRELVEHQVPVEWAASVAPQVRREQVERPV
jgi:hypothetical protein